MVFQPAWGTIRAIIASAKERRLNHGALLTSGTKKRRFKRKLFHAQQFNCSSVFPPCYFLPFTILITSVSTESCQLVRSLLKYRGFRCIFLCFFFFVELSIFLSFPIFSSRREICMLHIDLINNLIDLEVVSFSNHIETEIMMIE